jgi:hypothetical protein
MRLNELDDVEGAAIYMERAVELLNQGSLGESERQLLKIAHFFLGGVFSRIGRPDLVKEEVAALEKLSEDGEGRELVVFLEHLLASRAFVVKKGADGTSDALLKSYAQLIAATRESKESSWQGASQEFEAMGDVMDGLLRAGSAEEFWSTMLGLANTSTGVGRGIALLEPFLTNMREGDEFEGRVALRPFLQEFLNTYNPPVLQRAQTLMALAMTHDDQTDENLLKSGEAVNVFETYISGLQVDEFMTGLIDEIGYQLYRQAVEIRANANPEEAFNYAERGRAWLLRRLLANPQRGVREPCSQEIEVLTRISALERDMHTELEPEVLDQMKMRLREEYGGVRLRCILSEEKVSNFFPATPLTSEKIRNEVLSPGNTLLAYFPGSDRLFIWLVDQKGVEIVPTSLPDDHTFACLIQSLRWEARPLRAITKPRGSQLLMGCGDAIEPDAAASELYSRLISPIAPFLPKAGHLIVVPYGTLHQLPFAALRNPKTGRYLVEDYTLSSAPSANALAALTQGSERRRVASEVLVLGNPTNPLGELVGARKEAERVAALFDKAPLLGDDATEGRIYETAGRSRLIHLATHGEYVSGSPYFSRVYLNGDNDHDGMLEMHEIWDRLDLEGTELVVLSGCETALGKVTRGDEIVGLTRAFLAAGSRAVISTLWPVEDEASAELMVAFYKRFVQERATVADALRGAQLDMLTKPETSAPYYWAGFMLTGDATNRWRPEP